MIDIFYLLIILVIIYIIYIIIFSKKCPYCECKYCKKTPDYYSCNVFPSTMEIALKMAKPEYGNVCFNCFLTNPKITTKINDKSRNY